MSMKIVNMKKKDYSASELKEILDEAIGDHSEELEELMDIPNIHHALFQHEVNRLERKLGADHTRVTHLKESMKRNQAIINSLQDEVEGPVFQLLRPQIRNAMVLGRVIDNRSSGISGLSIAIENEDGQRVPFVSDVRTDSSGHFSMSLDEGSVDKIIQGVGGVGHLTVRDSKGEVVHQDAAPLTISHGEQVSMDISVSEKGGILGRGKMTGETVSVQREVLKGAETGIPTTPTTMGTSGSRTESLPSAPSPPAKGRSESVPTPARTKAGSGATPSNGTPSTKAPLSAPAPEISTPETSERRSILGRRRSKSSSDTGKK